MNRFGRIFERLTGSRDDPALDAPGSSLLAIKRKRALIGGELRAHLYLHAKARYLVTSIMSVPGSIILEVGTPSVLAFDVTDESLGRTICDHLLDHDARQPPNLRARRPTDWLVFQASGESTAAGFKDKSSCVSIETFNFVLELEAAPVANKTSDICVKATTQPLHRDLGALVRQTLAGADALQAAGIT